MYTRFSKTFLYAFTLTFGIFTGFIAVAWTGPTGTAPNNNVGAPLNVSSTGQAKAGGLELNTGGATNGLIVHGKVGIDTTSPQAKLQVGGTSNTSNDSFYVNSTGNTVGGVYYGGNTNGLILGNYATAPWPGTNGLFVGGTSILYGAVAIGTTNPYNAAGLTIDHGGTGSWAEIVNYYSGTPAGAYGLWVHGSTLALNADGPITVNGTITSTAPAGSYGTSFYSPNQPGMYSRSDSSYGMYAHSGTSWGGVITQDNGNAGLVVERSDGAIYSELMSSGYGLLTNQSVLASDVCTTSGKCLSSTNSGPIVFGGFYLWNGSNGTCQINNPWTGSCSCPAYAPNPRYSMVASLCCTFTEQQYICTN